MEFQFDQKGLQFIVSIAQNLPDTFYSESKRLKQVLFNLLGNASKFNFQGHAAMIVEVNERDEMVRFAIKDTGIGIAQKDL